MISINYKRVFANSQQQGKGHNGGENGRRASGQERWEVETSPLSIAFRSSSVTGVMRESFPRYSFDPSCR